MVRLGLRLPSLAGPLLCCVYFIGSPVSESIVLLKNSLESRGDGRGVGVGSIPPLFPRDPRQNPDHPQHVPPYFDRGFPRVPGPMNPWDFVPTLPDHHVYPKEPGI